MKKHATKIVTIVLLLVAFGGLWSYLGFIKSFGIAAGLLALVVSENPVIAGVVWVVATIGMMLVCGTLLGDAYVFAQFQ